HFEPLEHRLSPATHTWTGGGFPSSNVWSDPANWSVVPPSQNTAPMSGEANVVLIFPAVTTTTTTNNDITNLTVQAMTITGTLTSSYSFDGNPITLTGSINDSSATGPGLPLNRIGIAITL